ncbi:N,N-dimethylformamidase beta subunit family domain-containing protein [Pseudonocardia nigra]|uniref:N,N-dimethylformamidase beta subunit family domain-containing protein n=1 Tax=Pseudonocardia nigra TaxID=1921578 RepID=UPI001C5CCE75|nr:N,N-dimethylformamidase beta subunit family domain-containing protein [Pseudonocardia nigra]
MNPPQEGNQAGVIEGYPDEPSVFSGDRLVLRVSTDAPAFRVLVHRCGADLEAVGEFGPFDGRCAPRHLPFQDWGEPGVGLRGEELPGWAAYALQVPREWQPGVHLATLVEGEGRAPAAPAPDARTGQALFVVRPRRPAASILYKLPLLTYHAYNVVAHDPLTRWCLYNSPAPGVLPGSVPPAVSVRRPGGGTGGFPWDVFNFDPFDPTPRQTFVHWDARFLAFLERSGHRVDHCTDLDLHRDPALLDGYRLLVSAGHDEYWTDAMRDHAEALVRAGGNIAFFGGNTCWWRVVFDDAHSFRRVTNWSDAAGPDRPENLLTGVTFRHGGERDRDDHPLPVGYRVQHADHWALAGTGLRDGDVFGDRPGEYLIGYECDGAHFDRAQLRNGHPVRPSGDDGTPPDFTILGIGDTAPSGWGHGNRAATMGLYTAGGTVFTASTTDWPRLLADPGSPVAQVTRNVLDRLAAP